MWSWLSELGFYDMGFFMGLIPLGKPPILASELSLSTHFTGLLPLSK